MNPFILPEQQYGTSLESLLERRERVAKNEGTSYGSARMFPGLVRRVMAELPAGGGQILEVDAGSGMFTRLLLKAGHTVTALEPVPILARVLGDIKSDRLDVRCGFVEDFFSDSIKRDSGPKAEARFDSAIVSFPARRGRGILALICELLPLVKDKLILLLPDDGSVDWTSTMRAVSLKGFHVCAEFVVDTAAIEAAQAEGRLDLAQIKRSMFIVIDATPLMDNPLCPSQIIDAWGASIRVIEVPYPVPRGAATRLIRYFKAGGDRSILIKTEPEGMHHLYGNLRTAAHRIARDQITVRRADNGIQLMQIVQSDAS